MFTGRQIEYKIYQWYLYHSHSDFVIRRFNLSYSFIYMDHKVKKTYPCIKQTKVSKIQTKGTPVNMWTVVGLQPAAKTISMCLQEMLATRRNDKETGRIRNLKISNMQIIRASPMASSLSLS